MFWSVIEFKIVVKNEFILANLNQLGYKSNPFILASQAKQVFYVNVQIQRKWTIVCHMPTAGNPYQINEYEVIMQ